MKISMDQWAKKRLSPRDRIEIAVMPEPNSGCWLWTQGTNAKGYAQLRYAGRMYRANRFSWAAHYGDIPTGQQVLHRCDNPLCVNPQHLFLGTNLDNVADRVRKGRGVVFVGINHPRAKLTEDDVHSIRASTLTLKQLALQFGVSTRAIHCAKTGITWSHLEGARA